MLLVMVSLFMYWTSESILANSIALIFIGFLIYGPVMLIGVHALDLVPKKAAGTAAGLTGLFGYLGGALFANIAMGVVVDYWGWSGGFVVLIGSCIVSIFLLALSWYHESNGHNGIHE
jgi:OPA family glycerol-3-phosphate transporter-like MFS transporter